MLAFREFQMKKSMMILCACLVTSACSTDSVVEVPFGADAGSQADGQGSVHGDDVSSDSDETDADVTVEPDSVSSNDADAEAGDTYEVKKCKQDNDCDDGDVCTVDLCAFGMCAHKSVECAEGRWCISQPKDNVVETGCIACTKNSDCDDGDKWTKDTCGVTGNCYNDLISQCEDDTYCEDHNPCTVDTCNMDTKECVFTPKGGLTCFESGCMTYKCSDGGLCSVAVKKKCEDNNTCTIDTCDPVNGCQHKWYNPCNDGDPCTDDMCAPSGCEFYKSQNKGCKKCKEVEDCDDDNVCTADDCIMNPGESLGACANTNYNEVVGCNDGDKCTTGDVCNGNKCKGLFPFHCDDGNVCTSNLCNPKTGCVFKPGLVGKSCFGSSCLQFECNKDGGCFPLPSSKLDKECDDGSVCTKDSCTSSGECSYVSIGACNDGNSCTVDTCDPKTGCKHEPISEAICLEKGCLKMLCEKGACNKPFPSGLTSMKCDDGTPCTVDICLANGTCFYEFVSVNGHKCDDGNACTKESTCLNGGCMPKVKPEKSCNDQDPCTDDICDPKKGCQHKNNSWICDDGNACTQGDGCKDGKCQPGKIYAMCGDGNACTNDACDPKTGKCTNKSVKDGSKCDDWKKGTVDSCKSGKCESKSLGFCTDYKDCTGSSFGKWCAYDQYSLMLNPPQGGEGGGLCNECNPEWNGFPGHPMGCKKVDSCVSVKLIDVNGVKRTHYKCYGG